MKIEFKIVNYKALMINVLIVVVFSAFNTLNAKDPIYINDGAFLFGPSIHVEYQEAGKGKSQVTELAMDNVNVTPNARISRYRNNLYQVVIHEINRGNYTEIDGELEYLPTGSSCITLRIILPLSGGTWKWYRGLGKSEIMKTGLKYFDTVPITTALPPDGAFNGENLSDGGYGDAVGQGTMSFYPLGAVSIDNQGKGLGIDLTIPLVYRLGAEIDKGLIAEFDVATSPLTEKFPNRAFFKLCQFDFNSGWGMRAALKQYYSIYPESFKKRVITEGIWLPFTALRSIPGWEDFGFAFHETSWNNSDKKDGKKLPNILSDKGTGVLSFQYTEPWDIQLPILTKSIPYDTLVSDKMIPKEHREYVNNSATGDKNGRWQARRLETPWFSSGWAVSITTNCDPDLSGYNRYQYVLQDEIRPAIKMNVDGIYFDSMEWNWHHDLNYRDEHFMFTDYPLTFSADVARPAIWNFVSEFEFMKKIADEMHSQGKLAMGNGHGWNPFAAANLDLFGAELNWYSSDDHNTEALDFKRAISYQKPIVFLLNEGLNDKAFTDSPYKGYEIYFEKLMAYGFFPSFFSVDASNDPYWKDQKKIEIGRPFFKKYIPIIKQIAGAGWEPVTGASCSVGSVRIERFGEAGDLFFTVRNIENRDVQCVLSLDLPELKISQNFSAIELVSRQPVKAEENKLHLTIPSLRTQVIQIIKK
ncbi:MAG: hypothetical protein NTV01_10730 [Bacteroidia bacterium]|nr:hypothetical protein [Bacteroidia bacterium]